MRLVERITAEGQRLFRLRSVAPLVLAPLLFLALMQMAQFELKWGEAVEDVWLVFCLCISVVGVALRCATVGFVPSGTSGRGRGTPSAAVLNRLGMYSVVRNPLYLANGIMWLGVALSTTSILFAAVTALMYWLYIERVISAEEEFLVQRFGDGYREWVGQTPCFLPRFSQWRSPQMSFSVRSVLRREYPALIALGVAFTLVEVVSDVLLEGEPWRSWLVTDRGWVFFFAITVLAGLGIRLLKKLHWLDAEGR
ncbi:MAG TPA: isoprenylcysteine carboxylmethyltransferase family protein [Steroidobacteraceae bacterium]|jgi:protein-S-isoprenylcysteine O-methyltransferase Ste14|nr:isoprenylcysteine carboxylmethyltransferase family protein [Steroidobacteraceae bacterium]